MEKRPSRLTSFFFALAMATLSAAPSMALSFTVAGYELGERIGLTNGTQVWTAQLDATLEGVAGHVQTFCVDLDTHISVGSYTVNDVLNAFTAPSPIGETPRNLAWAGFVVTNYGVDQLAVGDVTRAQAIAGIQAAIWEGIYGGNKINVSTLSANALSIYKGILGAGGLQLNGSTIGGYATVVDLRGYQDQIFRGSPVPEPSAALVFGFGMVVAGSMVRRRAA